MSLRIESVEVFGVAMPLAGSFTSGGVSKDLTRCVVVRLTDSEGGTGVGSIDPSTMAVSPNTAPELAQVLRERLAPAMQGRDPRDLAALLKALHALAPMQPGAVAGAELACADLVSRRNGLALHDYLGGALVRRLRFNAWIGQLPPAEAADEARRWLSAGFQSAKIKVGGDVTADAQRVAAVRDAVGSAMELRIDANQQYDVRGALALCDAVRHAGLQLFEQPVPRDDLEGMRTVRTRGGVPVMADESIDSPEALIRVIKADCADFVKFGIKQVGGLWRAAHMLATAEAAGLPVVLGHGFGLDLSTMAEIMLASTSTNVLPGLECVGPLKVTDTVATERLDLRSGALDLPVGPGIGITLDHDKLSRYGF